MTRSWLLSLHAGDRGIVDDELVRFFQALGDGFARGHIERFFRRGTLRVHRIDAAGCR